MVVLIDCDNFFASCERVMQPQYAKRPVVVLSNNDGCVIARSNEAKAAGVAMGQPYFMCSELLEKIGAGVFSANFLLYRHFAKRLQGIFQTLPAQSIDIYSIDESFIEFKDEQISDPILWGTTLRKLILDWTGIPVSIGIAPSRALAKVATRMAKKNPTGVGILKRDDHHSELFLKSTDIADVWGIGRKLAPKFKMLGVVTAWDLTQIELSSPIMNIIDKPMKELIFQLKGWNVAPQETKLRQSIRRSRSFSYNVNDSEGIRSSLVDFSSQVAAKLRDKQLYTNHLKLAIYKKIPHSIRGVGKYYEETFDWTNDVFIFSQVAERAAKKLYVAGESYTRAMVYCDNLKIDQQLSIEHDHTEALKKSSLLDAIYELESLYGAAGPQIATKLLSSKWKGKKQLESPYNHAAWNKLPPVQAG